MKLKYFLDTKGNKEYTLDEESPEGEKTKDAHYKYIKIKDCPTSN